MDIHAYLGDLQERTQAARGHYRDLLDLMNHAVSYSWISGFACGRLNNPRINALIALDRALERLRLRTLREAEEEKPLD